MFPFITNLLTNRYWTLLLVVQAGREIVSSVTSLFYKPVLQVRKIALGEPWAPNAIFSTCSTGTSVQV